MEKKSFTDESVLKNAENFSYSNTNKFVTRVDVNFDLPNHVTDADTESTFNFMHDPSTMMHYTPDLYCNNTEDCKDDAKSKTSNAISRSFDICITTTKPSLPESENMMMTGDGGSEKSDKSEHCDTATGDGLLIVSNEFANENSNDISTKMHLLDVKNVSTIQAEANRSTSSSPQSVSCSGGQSPELSQQQQYRRKVSLMPLVTEEELKNHPMGHKDPISVAQVFGDDFASKFCVQPPLLGSSPTSAFSLLPPRDERKDAASDGKHSPLPYDNKDKMVRRQVSLEAALLPFEIRDKNLPKGVPTVKVRRKPVKLSLQYDINCIPPQSAPLPSILMPDLLKVAPEFDSADDTYEVALALSPVTPKFPSLPASAMTASTSYSPGQAATGVFSFDVKQLNSDIGAGNPDIVCFQREMNAWLKKQSSIISSAFVLTSSDTNSCYCEVCGSTFLDDPIICGDSEYLRTLFDFPQINQHRGQPTTEEMIRVQHRRQQIIDNPQLLQEEQDTPTVLDLRRIRKEKPFMSVNGLCTILRNICTTTDAICDDHDHLPSTSAAAYQSIATAVDGDDSGGNASTQERSFNLQDRLQQQKQQQKQQNRQSQQDEQRYEIDEHERLKLASDDSHLTATVAATTADNTTDEPPNSIVGIQAKCGFTAGLILAHRNEKNRKEDLDMILPHISLMATLMSIIDNVEEQKRLAQQTQRFLAMTQNVFSSLQDMNELVRNITREAKALVQAEICSLFLLDKEHSELVAEVFEKNGTSDEYLTEIRMPLNQGIVGHVATTGQMLNVRNVNENPYFYKKVDEMTGFTTRNILCFPIKDEKGNLVGVAELCNKIGRKAFTRQDEQCAATFSVYCALSISHCLLYRKLQEAHRRSHMAAELLVQGSTLSIAPEDILRLTVRDIPSPTSFHPEFNHFSFVPRSIGTGDTYVEASLSMFKDLGFIDRYRLRRRTLARFLLMVQKGYRDVPYHNWSHAFAVGHFCYLLIRIPAIMSALTDLERFALLVACLCHDIDHRGTTNAFQLQSRTPLAQLYSSEGSVLERHHFAQTVTILGMEECNIFDQLTRSQYQQVLDHIREIILATDIAAHLRKVRDMRKMVENPDGYNRHSMEHRYLLTCLLMTASDLSDQSKDFKNSKAIAENIYKEFFSQGDLEKQMGNEPNVMMDRDRACVPKIQLHFMDTVALPVFEFAAQLLPELRSTYDSMLMNCVCWQELEAILQEEGHASGGLDYLHDAELERKVFSRLSQRNDLHGQVKALIPRNLPVSAPFTAAEAEAYMRARHSDAVTLANAAAAVAGADVGNNNNNNKNNYSTPTSARSAVTSVSSRLSMTSSFLPSTSADLSPSTSRSTCEQTSKSEDVSAKSSKS